MARYFRCAPSYYAEGRNSHSLEPEPQELLNEKLQGGFLGDPLCQDRVVSISPYGPDEFYFGPSPYSFSRLATHASLRGYPIRLLSGILWGKILLMRSRTDAE